MDKKINEKHMHRYSLGFHRFVVLVAVIAAIIGVYFVLKFAWVDSHGIKISTIENDCYESFGYNGVYLDCNDTDLVLETDGVWFIDLFLAVILSVFGIMVVIAICGVFYQVFSGEM